MGSNLKRDQLPQKQAQNWRQNFNEETKISFNLKLKQIILQKETYKLLAGENENRVRIYLGLEPEKENDQYVLCAYAVSAFLLGSGDVYVDYETPVYKLEKENENWSDNTNLVIENIRRYRQWRNGELDSENEFSPMRKYIYPNAYLMTKFELHDIFVSQNKKEAEINFGISKTMTVMICNNVVDLRTVDDNAEAFDFVHICPPVCDERSIFNS